MSGLIWYLLSLLCAAAMGAIGGASFTGAPGQGEEGKRDE